MGTVYIGWRYASHLPELHSWLMYDADSNLSTTDDEWIIEGLPHGGTSLGHLDWYANWDPSALAVHASDTSTTYTVVYNAADALTLWDDMVNRAIGDGDF